MARRVSPSGKFATEPTWIHDWPPERRIGAVMNPITGIPTSAAPTTFNASPSLNRNPRREDMALVLSVHRAGRGVSVDGGEPGNRPPLGHEPRCDIRDVLRR